MSSLEALNDAELRARYQAVIGTPPPKGPAITRAILINAIAKHSKYGM